MKRNADTERRIWSTSVLFSFANWTELPQKNKNPKIKLLELEVPKTQCSAKNFFNFNNDMLMLWKQFNVYLVVITLWMIVNCLPPARNSVYKYLNDINNSGGDAVPVNCQTCRWSKTGPKPNWRRSVCTVIGGKLYVYFLFRNLNSQKVNFLLVEPCPWLICCLSGPPSLRLFTKFIVDWQLGTCAWNHWKFSCQAQQLLWCLLLSGYFETWTKPQRCQFVGNLGLPRFAQSTQIWNQLVQWKGSELDSVYLELDGTAKLKLKCLAILQSFWDRGLRHTHWDSGSDRCVWVRGKQGAQIKCPTHNYHKNSLRRVSLSKRRALRRS